LPFNLRASKRTIITVRQGDGQRISIGGVLIHESIKASYGCWENTCFGGNHFGLCRKDWRYGSDRKRRKLIENAAVAFEYFKEKSQLRPTCKRE